MAHRTYVQVTVRFDEEGNARPLAILFQGANYPIDRILNRCRAAATKAGGQGMRYTVRICNQETFLFQDENQRWFVEEKDNIVQTF